MEVSTSVGLRIAVPAQLQALARSAEWFDQFVQVASDVWVTNMLVSPHTDSTADGLVTYGLVIINDANAVLLHGGQEYEIPPGTLYRIDGRVEHCTCGAHGLFAALIWDMPPEWELEDFAAELSKDERFR